MFCYYFEGAALTSGESHELQSILEETDVSSHSKLF